EIAVDLRPGVSDLDLATALGAYLGSLEADGMIASWRLLRRTLGLGSGAEVTVLIETRELAQLDAAFRHVSTRAQPSEGLHHGVNALVTNFPAALYRDFPDPHRVHGEEAF